MASFAQTKGRTIGYGLLIFLVWMLAAFISSLITGTQGKDAADVDFNSAPLVISGIVIAVLLGVVANWLCRTLRLDTKRNALTVGAWWVIILVLLQILNTMPYQTTGMLFGAWVMYLPYLAILAGAVYGVPKSPSGNQPMP